MRRQPLAEKVAVGYCRVSTSAQAHEGISLDAQKARVEAWALANGYRLAAVHVDAGISGGRASNRPALQAALADVCRARGALVIYSLSRLARSLKDTLQISERLDRVGADLVSLSESIDTTSAAGRLVFRLLAALSEFEKDVIAERTRESLAYKRSRGERVSRHAPFGSRHEDGRTVPDEGEQATLRRLRELREEGLSLRALAAKATAEQLACRGRRWYASSIGELLARSAV